MSGTDFAARLEERIAQERHAGVAEALRLLREGRPGRAHWVMQRSFRRQLLVAGLGTAFEDGAA